MPGVNEAVSDLFGITSELPGHNAPLVDWALWYASKGIPVFPCAHQSKVPLLGKSQGGNGVLDATTDPEKIRFWWTAHPGANIGGACGTFMDALDIDQDGGLGYEKLDDKARAVVVVKTPSGGYHVWYQPNTQGLLNGVRFAPGLDFRTKGGYVLLPPSFVVEEAKGYEGHYEFHRALNGKPLTPMSEALMAAIAAGSSKNRGVSAKPPVQVIDGERNSTLFRYACRLRRDALEEDEIFAATWAVNLARCAPPLAEREVRTIANSAAKYAPTAAPVAPLVAPPVQGETSSRRKASEIQTASVPWLAYPYLARGLIHGVEGDPGVGKSFFAAALASAVSRGTKLPFCEDPLPRGRVLMYMTEDSSEYTTVPRLRDMGADLTQIEIVEDVFPLDLVGLNRMKDDAIAVAPTLIIIDPVTAYIDAATKIGRNTIDVHGIMTGLKQIAAMTGACVVCLRHLRKSSGSDSNPLYAGIGDISIGGKWRTFLQIKRDPDDRRICLVTQPKSNIGPIGATFGYEIRPINREKAEFYWTGFSEKDADDLAAPKRAEESQAVERAKEFLLDLLTGQIVKSEQVFSDAAKQDISKRTLWRAAKALPGIKTDIRNRRVWGDDKYRWSIEIPGIDAVTEVQEVGDLFD